MNPKLAYDMGVAFALGKRKGGKANDAEEKPVRFFTSNGAHIPVFEGENKKEALESFVSKKSNEEPSSLREGDSKAERASARQIKSTKDFIKTFGRYRGGDYDERAEIGERMKEAIPIGGELPEFEGGERLKDYPNIILDPSCRTGARASNTSFPSHRFSSEIRRALNDYSARDYQDLNFCLEQECLNKGRRPKGLETPRSELRKLDEKLQEAFRTATPLEKDIMVTRGCSWATFAQSFDKDGNYEERRYLSTSSSPKNKFLDNDVNIVYRVPRGMKAIDLMAVSSKPNEREILLDKGHRGKIRGIKREDGGYLGADLTVYVDLIP